MVDRRPAPAGLPRRGTGRRAWLVVVAMALAGVMASEVICHEEHEVGQDCTACQHRHQPAAELSGCPRIGFADVPESIEPADDGESITSGCFRRLPARGPPA